MARLILFFFVIFYSFILKCNELTNQERIYFNFLDLNNDNVISLEELDQSFKIIFQLIDLNKDGNLSESEIIELKSIIESLS
tara:strand:+ start:20 stop:265 length:246 start_codon:yes stop_codon:yes gene_type:complete